MKKVNLNNALSSIKEYWSPLIIEELNGQMLKLAKLKGEFSWHKHDDEDELFYVLKGQLTIELEKNKIELNEGETITIPRGTMHRPVANEEVHVLLFEPATTINTGNEKNEFTRDNLERYSDENPFD